jgi:hypothetical protein
VTPATFPLGHFATAVERPEIHVSRRARRETVDAQIDLEKMLFLGVMEQARFFRALRGRLLEAALQAFAQGAPSALPPGSEAFPALAHLDAPLVRLHIERAAELLAATRLLGAVHVRRSAGLPLATRHSPLATDFQFREELRQVKPEAAIRYLRGLRGVTRAEFEALTAAERRRAFHIAASESLSVMKSAANLIADSLERGWTSEQFEAAMRKLLGEFESGHRLRTVWNTNVARAKAEGREAELADPEVRALVGWRLFDAMMDEFTRDNHAAGDNSVAPADWWDAHDDLKPLLGFNCRCELFGITEARARKLIESGVARDLSVEGIPAGFHRDDGWVN